MKICSRITGFALSAFALSVLCCLSFSQTAYALQEDNFCVNLESYHPAERPENSTEKLVFPTMDDSDVTAVHTSLDIDNLLLDLDSIVTLTEEQKASKYDLANREYDIGWWKAAADSFKQLKDYKDSAKKYKMAYYKYGQQLLDEGKYEEAVSVYQELGNYERSKSKLKEAKYGYVCESDDPSDVVAYEYLCELKKENYKDTKLLYDWYFGWYVDITVNDSYNDEKTRMDCISRWDDIVCHLKLSGGPPVDKGVKLKVVATWPDGSTTTVRFDESWYAGDSGYAYFYYKNPAKGRTGKMKISVYESKSGKRLDSVKVTLVK